LGTFRSRPKRSALNLGVDPKLAINLLSRDILNAIEAVEKKPECLEFRICENNKRAKIVGLGAQVFIPIFT